MATDDQQFFLLLDQMMSLDNAVRQQAEVSGKIDFSGQVVKNSPLSSFVSGHL